MRDLVRAAFICIVSVVATLPVFAQEAGEKPQRFIITIPAKVPLGFEIINGELESPLDKVEIRIQNTGNRPIYFVELVLHGGLDLVAKTYMGLDTISIGNPQLSDFTLKAAESREAERAKTIPFEPGETRTFRLAKEVIELFHFKVRLKGHDMSTQKVFVDLSALSFGDGSGFLLRNATEMPERRSDKRP